MLEKYFSDAEIAAELGIQLEDVKAIHQDNFAWDKADVDNLLDLLAKKAKYKVSK